MRVLVVPDKFAGTLSAAAAAAAIAAGWQRSAPEDEIELVPLADGGPGFLDALSAALGGELIPVQVGGPYGDPVSAAVLLDATAAGGSTAYVESAQACGLHLTPKAERRPRDATSHGVGELIAAALQAGARRIVVGLGGSATIDAGAGALGALGARADVDLGSGPRSLAAITSLDLTGVRERLEGVELVIASDVDVPLLGAAGAIRGFGPQKGLGPAELDDAEAALAGFARLAGLAYSDRPGGGGGGGLGYGLLVAGGARVNGAQYVIDAVGLAERAAAADLIVTGEGTFDWQSLRGKVVSGVARVGSATGRPVVVLAGQVTVGRRELASAGVDAAYPVADGPQAVAAALERPAETLAALAERVALTWSPLR